MARRAAHRTAEKISAESVEREETTRGHLSRNRCTGFLTRNFLAGWSNFSRIAFSGLSGVNFVCGVSTRGTKCDIEIVPAERALGQSADSFPNGKLLLQARCRFWQPSNLKGN